MSEAKSIHIGSSLDSFLQEEGILEYVDKAAEAKALIEERLNKLKHRKAAYTEAMNTLHQTCHKLKNDLGEDRADNALINAIFEFEARIRGIDINIQAIERTRT